MRSILLPLPVLIDPFLNSLILCQKCIEGPSRLLTLFQEKRIIMKERVDKEKSIQKRQT